jgi:hypothetical protein
MRRGLVATLFPIKDVGSARVMLVKARSLLAAKVISEPEALARRANAMRRTCKLGNAAAGPAVLVVGSGAKASLGEWPRLALRYKRQATASHSLFRQRLAR